MKAFTTHYDNLKIARDAPIEVIHAAYRSLSQKYHPDRNPGNPDATRIMAILNAAHEVLSDPEKRRTHDKWIATEEAARTTEAQNTRRETRSSYDPKYVWNVPPRSGARPESSQSSYRQTDAHAGKVENTIGTANPFRKLLLRLRTADSALGRFYRHLPNLWFKAYIFAIVAMVAVAILSSSRSNGPKPYSQPTLYQPQPEPTAKHQPTLSASPKSFDFDENGRAISDESKPKASSSPLEGSVNHSWAKAPNGSAWPKSSRYVAGYAQLRMDGMSSVTIDNSQNDSAVHGRLFSLDDATPFPIRNFWIAPSSKFTVQRIRPGRYDVRYRDLKSGYLSRTEGFSLEEFPIIDQGRRGTRASRVTMTLYKVHNGNMQTYGIDESEF